MTSIRNHRAALPGETRLYYATPRRTNTRHGLALTVFFRPKILQESGIRPGHRVDIQVDREEGIARVARASQMGWLVRPPSGTGQCRTHFVRLAWSPDHGFPAVDASTPLEVLLIDPEEQAIVFKLPEQTS